MVKLKRRQRVLEDDDDEELETNELDEGYGSDSILPNSNDFEIRHSEARPKSSRDLNALRREKKDLPASRNELENLLEELKTHLCQSYRLEGLRTSLYVEMRRRDIGIGDMFALVDKDASWSIDN